jgi:outer membrane protein OmpA-like peptidoglycan-associated protein
VNLVTKSLRLLVGVVILTASLCAASLSSAETAPAAAPPVTTAPPVNGKIVWGIWVDIDGCMHWWADGGAEGYMVDRVDPKTGKPQCLRKNTCLVENTDTLFATDSAALTADGRRRLTAFFQTTGAFGYAIYGHTDSRASESYNMGLSQRRAASVAAVARSVGAAVQAQKGFGELMPIAPNDSAANMQKNRRVEIVCYRWSR